jgi:hypothetical protein
MGTRGLFTIIYQGKSKQYYVALDSYPSGLGIDLLEFIKVHIKTWSPIEIQKCINSIVSVEEYVVYNPDCSKSSYISNEMYKMLMIEYEYEIDFDEKSFTIMGDTCNGVFELYPESEIDTLIEEIQHDQTEDEDFDE